MLIIPHYVAALDILDCVRWARGHEVVAFSIIFLELLLHERHSINHINLLGKGGGGVERRSAEKLRFASLWWHIWRRRAVALVYVGSDGENYSDWVQWKECFRSVPLVVQKSFLFLQCISRWTLLTLIKIVCKKHRVHDSKVNARR